MKKLLSVTLTSALVLTVGTTSVFAMGRGNGIYRNNSEYHQGINHEYNSHFVDEDGDGICDNIGTRGYYVDEDGDGICDNIGTRGYYVDEDGDGICDNIGTSEYYVDANGDGICDNYGTGYRNSENHTSGNHNSGGRHHS